jgi:hypothetical protein
MEHRAHVTILEGQSPSATASVYAPLTEDFW